MFMRSFPILFCGANEFPNYAVTFCSVGVAISLLKTARITFFDCVAVFIVTMHFFKSANSLFRIAGFLMCVFITFFYPAGENHFLAGIVMNMPFRLIKLTNKNRL